MASIEELVQTVQNFIEPNSADSVHASKRCIKSHCCDVFLRGRFAVWLSSRWSRSYEFRVATIHGWKGRNTVIFRVCGKEFRQDEDFGIHLTAKDNTERVQPITCDVKHGLTRKATADDIHQLRSVKKPLAWIARQTRLDVSHRISKIQSTFENAYVRDLRECNRIVEYATSTSTRGIYVSPRIFLGRCSRGDDQ